MSKENYHSSYADKDRMEKIMKKCLAFGVDKKIIIEAVGMFEEGKTFYEIENYLKAEIKNNGRTLENEENENIFKQTDDNEMDK